MVDSHIKGCCWVEINAEKWKPHNKKHKIQTLSQIEIDVQWKDVIGHEPEGEWSAIAPIRILSFDIECAGRKGK